MHKTPRRSEGGGEGIDSPYQDDGEQGTEQHMAHGQGGGVREGAVEQPVVHVDDADAEREVN